jgi:hypothetical protein
VDRDVERIADARVKKRLRVVERDVGLLVLVAVLDGRVDQPVVVVDVADVVVAGECELGRQRRGCQGYVGVEPPLQPALPREEPAPVVGRDALRAQQRVLTAEGVRADQSPARAVRRGPGGNGQHQRGHDSEEPGVAHLMFKRRLRDDLAA